MKRLLPLTLVLAAALPLTGASASTCAEPADEPAQCCPPRYLLVVDEPPFSIYVQDPTQSPGECARIV